MEFDARDGAFDAQTFKSRTNTSNAVAPSSSRRQCGVKLRHQPYWHLSGEDGCRLYKNVALWFLFERSFCVRHAGSWTAKTVEPSFRWQAWTTSKLREEQVSSTTFTLDAKFLYIVS